MTITITNDPGAVTAPSPDSITVIVETPNEGNKTVSTLAEAYALVDTATDGTLIYVAENDTLYLKGATGLRPLIVDETSA